MPTAAKIQWPQGQPLFEVQWRAVAESLAGNGVRSATDLEVTATANDLEIQVASGTAYYLASESTLGSASTFTLSAGDGSSDRWDTVYYDTGTDSAGVREGTPAASPEPPDVQGDELLLAVVYVPANATDVPDSDVLNWRAQFSNEAEEIHYDDSTGTYSVSSVDAALDELQEAAQATAYPFALAVDTDMDVAGTDLTDAATVLYESANGWFRNEVVQALANLTGDEQFSGYPLAIGTDVAAHLGGNDLLASSGGITVYSNADGHVPRPQVDDQKATTTVTTATYTTSDEEVVLVDTATIGGASTITLASADAENGNTVVVSDLTGSAVNNPITVDTEGTETIHGQSSKTIETDGGALVFTSDGTNWALGGGGAGGGGADPTLIFEGRETGTVTAGNQGVLVMDNLPNGETVEVNKAALVLATGAAVGSSTTLELVTFDNAGAFTSQATLITGDGSTVFDRVTGDPIASYTNSSGGEQTVGVIVDNQETSDISIVAVAEGEVTA